MAEVSERRRLLGDAKGSGGEDGEGSAQATGGSGKIAAFVQVLQGNEGGASPCF